MLSQFTGGNETTGVLGDLYDFPKDVYSIGRLDKDSEGLLLLTNDNIFKNKVLSPNNKIEKTYYAQVEGVINAKAIQQLEEGRITIKHNKKDYRVAPAKCCKIDTPHLPERDKPIRYRKNIPTSWIALTIKEGKNRQVRKMTAAVSFPTLRLIRVQVGNLKLGEMQPGDVVKINPKDVF